jgi:hypothetical protein
MQDRNYSNDELLNPHRMLTLKEHVRRAEAKFDGSILKPRQNGPSDTLEFTLDLIRRTFRGKNVKNNKIG